MKVIILSGISGSGKSTLAAERYPNAVVVSADDYFMDADDVYRFNPAHLPQAHMACLRDFIETVVEGREPLVVVDNTNTTLAEIAPYYAAARAFGYDVELISVKCSVEVAAARNRHGVPMGGIVGQAERLAQLQLPPFWELDHFLVE
jgi:predicted kinase